MFRTKETGYDRPSINPPTVSARTRENGGLVARPLAVVGEELGIVFRLNFFVDFFQKADVEVSQRMGFGVLFREHLFHKPRQPFYGDEA